MVDVWSKLGSDVLTEAGNTLAVDAFTTNTNIYFQAFYKLASGASNPLLTVNGSSDDYSYEESIDGDAFTSPAYASTDRLINNSVSDATVYDQGYIFNESGKEALAVIHSSYSATTGAGTAPNRRQYYSKWSDTDAITSVEYTMGTGNFESGSMITVYGSAGVAGTTTYPSLPNGTVFITSDTNVHYMWNSSAETWNEVA